MFLLLFITPFCSLISQLELTGIIQIEMTGTVADAAYVTTSNERYSSTDSYLPDEVIGSPFVEEIFQPGVLYESDRSPTTNLYYRYNSYEDDIEVKNNMYDEDKDILILTKSPKIVVKISSDLFMYDEKISGYYQVLFQGNKFKLYKRYNKILKPARRAQTSFELDILATYAERPAYFLYSSVDGDIFEIPPSKRKRVKFFGNKQTEINKYVTKYKLDISELENFIKALRYFDSFEDASLK